MKELHQHTQTLEREREREMLIFRIMGREGERDVDGIMSKEKYFHL